MTMAELYSALSSLGMAVAYGEFTQPTELPFLTYQFVNDNDKKADNQNYAEISNFRIELYTAKKDPDKETLVQNKLKELRLPYSKLEAYISSENMRQVIYEIQLVGAQ